jgi:ATP/maltotriose-dependent transcriptional regulator MalT
MLEQAVGTARRSESRVAIYTALFSLARAAAANGDYDTARLLDCEALDLQRSQGDHAFMGITLSRYAQTLIRLGLLAEARAALEESFGLQRMVGPNQSFVSLLDPLVELTLAEQDFVRAVQLDGAAEALHAAIGVPRAPARLRGVLENGRAQARNALGAATAEEVWSRGTRLSLEQAVRLGLQPVAIERAISNTRPIAAPADQLSKRELEIVRLVAVGSSNAEIASQLVLSVRTVERHLANIYAKLGAQGRSARALAVTRAIGSGLVTVR